MGEVTLVLSKRRFTAPPRQIKCLVTPRPDARTGLRLRYDARRWAVEGTCKELKSGLRGVPCKCREERMQRRIALPVRASVLLLRRSAAALPPEQRTCFLALQQRFRAAV